VASTVPVRVGPVRSFALTYPQLVTQARSLGVDDADLVRIRRTYDFAERMADGCYRPQGQPFITHLVRVASITLDEAPLVVALAAMSHAAYDMHHFSMSRRLVATPERRREVAAALGPDVEEYIWCYHQTDDTDEAFARHLERLEDMSDVGRDAVLMRLADALEDMLDLTPLFCTAPQPSVDVIATIARRLEREQLAQELEEAWAAYEAAPPLPEGVGAQRRWTYELPRQHMWERGPIAHFSHRARRKLQRLARSRTSARPASATDGLGTPD
jgi:(p)ppGpp synthase/HD superfamily hydrolase